MSEIKPIIICITPVKNEAWILDRFIQCVSLWADHIIIADQDSDDGSVEIACKYPKVTLIENKTQGLDEVARTKILLEAARKIPGKRLVVALDADEVLTGNWSTSPEWQKVLAAPEGTIIQFQWVHLLPDMQTCLTPAYHFSWGFMDDGSQHHGEKIHGSRVPIPESSPTIRLKDIKVLHYQYTDWERALSKLRWYDCWEHVNNTRKPLRAYRLYHRIVNTDTHRAANPIDSAWLTSYQRTGIDMTYVKREAFYRWDKEIIRMFQQHGTQTFSKCAVWDVDWIEKSRLLDMESNVSLADPRNAFEKKVHQWFADTQPKEGQLSVRVAQKLLQMIGW